MNIIEETIRLIDEYEKDYGDYHTAPYNDGELQRYIDNGGIPEEFDGVVNIDAFFRGYSAGGTVWEDIENAYDYDNGESKRQWQLIKDLKELSDTPKTVRIYRTVPNTVEDTEIHNGDWVTLSRRYAKEHGDLRYTDNYHILTMQTTTDKLWWDGQHICEFGYDDKPLIWDKNTNN